MWAGDGAGVWVEGGGREVRYEVIVEIPSVYLRMTCRAWGEEGGDEVCGC